MNIRKQVSRAAQRPLISPLPEEQCGNHHSDTSLLSSAFADRHVSRGMDWMERQGGGFRASRAPVDERCASVPVGQGRTLSLCHTWLHSCGVAHASLRQLGPCAMGRALHVVRVRASIFGKRNLHLSSSGAGASKPQTRDRAFTHCTRNENRGILDRASVGTLPRPLQQPPRRLPLQLRRALLVTWVTATQVCTQSICRTNPIRARL